MAAGLIKTSSPHCQQIRYIISTNVLLPNERLATAGAWRKIFNIFPFPLQLWMPSHSDFSGLDLRSPWKYLQHFVQHSSGDSRSSNQKYTSYLLPVVLFVHLDCFGVRFGDQSASSWTLWKETAHGLSCCKRRKECFWKTQQQNLFPKIMTPLLYLPACVLSSALYKHWRKRAAAHWRKAWDSVGYTI